ncbi:hypothetical protein VTK26DRAFT_6347 [Humicola hyalothermophila]
MDVHLLVYDLSRGLARQMSKDLLGFQLDAIYHTSIQLNGLEYVYDGNVVAIIPGSSHLGQPMQKMYLGKTELPMDVIEEYLDSLREIYTVGAYDLWRHNCNNFSNDFSMFLVGKGIPDHIINMPQAVLDSPLGQMLMPALNQQINATKRGGGILGIQQQTPGSSVKPQSELHHRVGKVHVVSNQAQLDQALEKFRSSCAVIFFTSATCPPCKTLYPLYDELAAEVGDRGVLIKVDISHAFDVGSRYSVSATPTFITFLRGKQENRWSGADPSALRGNIQLLVQMAWPPHPHEALNLPTFSNPDAKPVIFSKIPPLPKLLAKMDPTVAKDPSVQNMSHFLSTRASLGPAEAPLPDLSAFTTLIRTSLPTLPPDRLFPLVDLLRCALIDPRVSGLLAEEPTDPPHQTLTSILTHVASISSSGDSSSSSSYPLTLVTLHLACNLFSTPLFAPVLLSPRPASSPPSSPSLPSLLTTLLTAALLSPAHPSLRVAAACLLHNVALTNARARSSAPGSDLLPGAEQLELCAAAVEAVAREEGSGEALEGLLKGLGYLVYRAPGVGAGSGDGDGEERGESGQELVDLLRAVEAKEVVLRKGGKGMVGEGVAALVREVGEVLLGEGLGL